MKTNKQPLSIYIHIPFCIKKCLYCDFLSAPANREEQESYVKALICEIENYVKQYPIDQYEVISVFFGGGTPSLLEVEWIKKILEVLRTFFNFDVNVEISLECNPKTATREKMKEFYKAGINRLSIGLQSANDEELKHLGRLHNYEEFLDTFQWARQVGFKNINIDIMSALPGQTIESYTDTVCKVLELKPEHISAYSLIIEEGTPFYDIYGTCVESVQGTVGLPDEDTEREMYYLTKRLLREAGYERYEISNYAKKGFECKHNLTYWTGVDYVGFGIGAASYVQGVRYKDISNRNQYVECLYHSEFHADKTQTEFVDSLELLGVYEDVECLSKREKMEEFMYLGLRLIGGVSEVDFENKFQVCLRDIYGEVIEKMTEKGLMECNDRLRLTEKGLDVANYVMAEFLLS